MLLCLKAWCKWIYRIRQDKVATNKAIKHRIKNKEVKAILELELVKRDRWRRERTLQICLPRRIRINPWVACPITTRAPTGNQVPFYSIKTNWPPKEYSSKIVMLSLLLNYLNRIYYLLLLYLQIVLKNHKLCNLHM